MRTVSGFWRRSEGAASTTASTTVAYRPDEDQWIRGVLMFALALIVLSTLIAPLAASAQNLGTSPQFGQAVQGQQATTVEGTVLNIVNWSCNVIAPVIAVACLGIAGWHFKSGRGYMGWGVTGVSLMVISGLGRMAEGFITQAQGIQ
jgi:cytochrome bd-type quinol oxidase subunit 2